MWGDCVEIMLWFIYFGMNLFLLDGLQFMILHYKLQIFFIFVFFLCTSIGRLKNPKISVQSREGIIVLLFNESNLNKRKAR